MTLAAGVRVLGEAKLSGTPASAQALVRLVSGNISEKAALRPEATTITATSAFRPLATTLTIAPGTKDFVEVRYEPTSPGPASGALTLLSNDPDQASLVVELAGNVQGIGVGDSVLGRGWSWVDVQTGTQVLTPESMQGRYRMAAAFRCTEPEPPCTDRRRCTP